MLACISPVATFFSMTEVTIRFASSVKKIRTKPVKNEEAEGHLIEALYAEIEGLKQQLKEAEADKQRDIQERIVATQSCYSSLNSSWETEQEQSRAYEKVRRKTLHRLGLYTLREEPKDAASDTDPYLLNECSDPMLAGCLRYRLPRGKSIHVGSEPSCTVILNGLGVQPDMCSLICEDGCSVLVTLAAAACDKQDCRARRRGSLFQSGTAEVYLNGQRLLQDGRMQHGDQLRLGSTHAFRLVAPSMLSKAANAAPTGSADGATATGRPQQGPATKYAARLEERIGAKPASSVLQGLEDLQGLVDEANKITEELLGDAAHEHVFLVHVLTDLSVDEEAPKPMVALHRVERPEGGNGLPPEAASSCGRTVSMAWPAQRFRQRLEVMRDLYHEVSERDAPWGSPGDHNPWAESDDVPVVRAGQDRGRTISGMDKGTGQDAGAQAQVMPNAEPNTDAEALTGSSVAESHDPAPAQELKRRVAIADGDAWPLACHWSSLPASSSRPTASCKNAKVDGLPLEPELPSESRCDHIAGPPAELDGRVPESGAWPSSMAQAGSGGAHPQAPCIAEAAASGAKQQPPHDPAVRPSGAGAPGQRPVASAPLALRRSSRLYVAALVSRALEAKVKKSTPAPAPASKSIGKPGGKAGARAGGKSSGRAGGRA